MKFCRIEQVRTAEYAEYTELGAGLQNGGDFVIGMLGGSRFNGV